MKDGAPPENILGKSGTRGRGRPKGVPNKVPAKLKDMILNALTKAGGEDYLVAQANESPSSFLALIGKVLPTTLQGTGENGAIRIEQATHDAKSFEGAIARIAARIGTPSPTGDTQH